MAAVIRAPFRFDSRIRMEIRVETANGLNRTGFPRSPAYDAGYDMEVSVTACRGLSGALDAAPNRSMDRDSYHKGRKEPPRMHEGSFPDPTFVHSSRFLVPFVVKIARSRPAGRCPIGPRWLG